MTGKCCSKYYVIGSLITAVFLWAFDFLVHGNLFMHLYTETAALWRPESEMAKFMPFCIAHTVILAMLATGGFFCWREKQVTGEVGGPNCPYRKGIGFGIWVGLLLGISQASAYIFLPIPAKLAIFWLLAELVKWSLAGILLAKLYHWKEKSQSTGI